MIKASKLAEQQNTFTKVVFARIAVNLLTLTPEALINWVYQVFSCKRLDSFIKEREESLNVIDKFELLAVAFDLERTSNIDFSEYPWNNLKELIQIRNDYSHPKPDPRVYMCVEHWGSVHTDLSGYLQKELRVKNNLLRYTQTGLPRDKYRIMPEHAQNILGIVNDIEKRLVKIMCNSAKKIEIEDWVVNDSFTLCYPPDATLKDIPGYPTTK